MKRQNMGSVQVSILHLERNIAMRAGQFFQKHQGIPGILFLGKQFLFLCGTVNFLIQIFDGLL